MPPDLFDAFKSSADSKRAPTEDGRVSGVVRSVKFRNEDDGFTIFDIETAERDVHVVTGHAAGVTPGEVVSASGRWLRTDSFGWQLRADELTVSQPASVDGILRYLASGIIEGVGPGLAAKIVAKFGADTLRVVETDSELLRTVKGVGTAKIESIAEAFKTQALQRSIMVFLYGCGLGPGRATKVFKAYGKKTIDLIKDDPYRLAKDVEGFGFALADSVAQKLGFSLTCQARVRGALRHSLNEAASNGHCALPEDVLIDNAVHLLGGPDSLVVRDAALALVAEGELVKAKVLGLELYYRPNLRKAEDVVTRRVTELVNGEMPHSCEDLDGKIDAVETTTGKKLSQQQREAVRLAFTHKILVVTGGPGCGKTTLLDALLRLYKEEQIDVLCAAPTGRAARRITEATGAEAHTLHRLLGFGQSAKRGAFAKNADNPLDCGVLVIDEASMIDMPLARHLLDALPEHASIVLVGDADQLPSVGPGLFLLNMIQAGTIPVVRLTQVFRQAENSRITLNAHRVNRGLGVELAEPNTDTDFYFVERSSTDGIRDCIIDLVQNRIPKKFGLHPRRDIQVLSPMHKHGIGTTELNTKLQAVVNPGARAFKVRGDNWLREGDRVIQTRNNYERGNGVFNGDLGEIVEIDEAERNVFVRFESNLVEYPFAETDELALAYALTIHRSQGSEYPAVIVPIAMQHYVMLQRNLLYTAITRGKRLVVLVGEKSALRRAIENNPTVNRYSGLLPRLQEIGR
jgi:exodeoxyribonuclease V alpha subunit